MTQIHPMTDYWDEAFVREVESTAVSQGVLIWALSGPSFVLRTPRSLLYIDPFLGDFEVLGVSGDPFLGGDFAGAPAGMYRTTAIPIDPRKIRAAHAVLMTHNHYDHCHRETVQGIAAGTSASFYGPATVAQDALGFGVPPQRVKQVSVGDRLQLADVAVTVWPGNDPGESQAVCYTLETQGLVIFFAGDSLDGSYLDQVGAQTKVDIAMLAFGRTWYMSPDQLLVAAARLRRRVKTPPIHRTASVSSSTPMGPGWCTWSPPPRRRRLARAVGWYRARSRSAR